MFFIVLETNEGLKVFNQSFDSYDNAYLFAQQSFPGARFEIINEERLRELQKPAKPYFSPPFVKPQFVKIGRR